MNDLHLFHAADCSKWLAFPTEQTAWILRRLSFVGAGRIDACHTTLEVGMDEMLLSSSDDRMSLLKNYSGSLAYWLGEPGG